MFVLLAALALAPDQTTTQWAPGGDRAWTEQSGHDQRAAIQLQKLATSGDVVAMRDYGLLLWKGQTLHRDREAAVGWFYEAALRNDPVSMYILGRAFERGEGVGKDLKLADYWTARAFQAGFNDDKR
jgi:TPR repeat protein